MKVNNRPTPTKIPGMALNHFSLMPECSSSARLIKSPGLSVISIAVEFVFGVGRVSLYSFQQCFRRLLFIIRASNSSNLVQKSCRSLQFFKKFLRLFTSRSSKKILRKNTNPREIAHNTIKNAIVGATLSSLNSENKGEM